MSGRRQPDFLGENDWPTQRIRCPVHGFIRFSENERRIIDHPLFQRLRLIRQLALTELIYPGATHTRFEHSLGVMEVATKAFDALADRRGSRLEDVFKQVAGFEDRTLAKARQYLRLAALLHDVGHTCFSHAAEHVLGRGECHEKLSLAIIQEPELLGGELGRCFGEDASHWVGEIIDDESISRPPQLKLLKDLVSGQMDADRTDYLLRDSHHCGVDYGRFDHLRLIDSLDIHEAFDGELQLALSRGGVHAFEALVLARYQMNTQVYFHRLRRIYDRYLQSYFTALGENAPRNRTALLETSDQSMTVRIWNDAETAEEPIRIWAQRIRNRKHHRVVHETSDHASGYDLRHAERVFRQLQAAFPDREFVKDIADGNNHKLLLPEDDRTDGVTMVVYGRDGSARQVGEESQILRRIPRRFQCARVFADLDRSDEDREVASRMEEVARGVVREGGAL